MSAIDGRKLSGTNVVSNTSICSGAKPAVARDQTYKVMVEREMHLSCIHQSRNVA